MLLLSHINSCETCRRVCGHSKMPEPQEDKKKTNEMKNSSGKYYAFPAYKRTTRRRRTSILSNVRTELTWPRVSTQLHVYHHLGVGGLVPTGRKYKRSILSAMFYYKTSWILQYDWLYFCPCTVVCTYHILMVRRRRCGQ